MLSAIGGVVGLLKLGLFVGVLSGLVTWCVKRDNRLRREGGDDVARQTNQLKKQQDAQRNQQASQYGKDSLKKDSQLREDLRKAHKIKDRRSRLKEKAKKGLENF